MKLALSKRDRKLLMLAAAALLVYFLIDFWILPYYDSLAEAADKITADVRRVTNYRKALGGEASVKAALETATRKLTAIEAGLLTSSADTQASAEIQDVVKNLILAKGMNFRRSDSLPVRPISPEYGKISTRVEFFGSMEQFMELASELEKGKGILQVEELRIQPASGGIPRVKTLNFSVTISGFKRVENSSPAGGKKS